MVVAFWLTGGPQSRAAMASPVSQLRSVLHATKYSQTSCPRPKCPVIGSRSIEYDSAEVKAHYYNPNTFDLLVRNLSFPFLQPVILSPVMLEKRAPCLPM